MCRSTFIALDKESNGIALWHQSTIHRPQSTIHHPEECGGEVVSGTPLLLLVHKPQSISERLEMNLYDLEKATFTKQSHPLDAGSLLFNDDECNFPLEIR